MINFIPFKGEIPLTPEQIANQAALIQHPLLTVGTLLPTKVLQIFCEDLKKTVLLRESGSYYVAPSGLGKSAAMKYGKPYLEYAFPQLPVFKHNAENHQAPSIRAFFKHFLDSVGHANIKGETTDLRKRLIYRLIDDARYSGWNMVVMLLDEANAMSIYDFLFLKDVSNALEDQGINLVTVITGQDPEFEEVLYKLRENKRVDLITRFARSRLPFPTYKDSADITEILTLIDEMTYPVGTTCTWTQFFFPKAYAAGFRLKNEAHVLFDEMNKNIKNELPFISARLLFITIRAFVVVNANYDSDRLKIPKDAWGGAVKHAKIQETHQLLAISTEKELNKSNGKKGNIQFNF